MPTNPRTKKRRVPLAPTASQHRLSAALDERRYNRQRRRCLRALRLRGGYISSSVIAATPAVMLKPVAPWKLSGCSENDLLEPPTSTLAVPPSPITAPPDTPT